MRGMMGKDQREEMRDKGRNGREGWIKGEKAGKEG